MIAASRDRGFEVVEETVDPADVVRLVRDGRVPWVMTWCTGPTWMSDDTDPAVLIDALRGHRRFIGAAERERLIRKAARTRVPTVVFGQLWRVPSGEGPVLVLVEDSPRSPGYPPESLVRRYGSQEPGAAGPSAVMRRPSTGRARASGSHVGKDER